MQVAEYIGLSQSAYSDWERGVTAIDSTSLGRLSDLLGVSADYILGKTGNASAPVVASRPGDKIAAEFARLRVALNDDGMDQLLNYGRYLAQQPELKRTGTDEPIDLPTIRHYFTGPAAGKAAPVMGEDYEEIVYPSDAPRGADFCVDVRGDSMEPYIKDGSRVYVRRDASLQQFDTGVFFYAGDVYIKQYNMDYSGGVNLLSANPRRADCNVRIDKENLQYLVCYGKVLLPRRLPDPNYGYIT